MRRSIPLFGAAAFFTLAYCSNGDGGTGGTSSTGGAPNTGGVVAAPGGMNAAGGSTVTSGGSTTTGGVTSSTGGVIAAGGSAMGGTLAAAGTQSSGGQQAMGGTTSAPTGGATQSGGTSGAGGASAGTTATGGSGGSGGAAAPYKGPCDLLPNGCAEAFSMTRAMTASYTGPLFQLGLANDKNAKTLDIGQTADHKVDMSTWSAYCGGSQSKCVVSKIYAQIHKGANDLLPAVWKAPWGPDCSPGGYTCAARFTIESATGLPILTTVTPQEYALSGDNFATGVNGGSKAIGLFYNGKPVPNQEYCCGVFGITHKYNAEDVHGTDFMVALAHGWRDEKGCCIAVNCGKQDSYCVGAEEEENNDLYDYGNQPVENAMVVTQFDPGANAVITYMNGAKVLTHSPPKAKINAGTAIHLGGGGDLSQPDPVLMREAFITNTLMSADDVAALKANVQAFYPGLKYP